MMKEKKKEIRHKLWWSLELSVIKRDLILFGILDVVFLMIYGLRLKEPERWIMIGIIQLVILPFAGFYLWRMGQIFRKSECYTFHRCKLSQPRHRPFLKAMYFDILVEDPDGSRFITETHAIFAPYGILEPLMENYINQTVTIAYNPETELVVVIG